jgi:hypothetical protein
MTVMGFDGGGSVCHSEYTPIRLCRVPDAADTEALADQMATVLRNALAESAGPQDVANSLGWRYREGPIGSATSTVESLLVPLNRGGFSVVVNTHRSPSPEHSIWLTAHEIGHSFFYMPGSPPRRIVPVTAEEEIFCDAFATSLLRSARKYADTNACAA